MRDGGAARELASARFAEAHRALVADPSVQFQLTRPPPPVPTPAWLRTLGEWIEAALRPIARAFRWLGRWLPDLPDLPYAKILLWSAIALLLAGVAWAVVERVRYGVWRWPRWRRRRAGDPTAAEEPPLFEPAPVRAWLREADALAAAGRFAEAVHLLLVRSVEDLARRRPAMVQPALTARELAAAPGLPPPARERFAAIARLVERSLFGGRPVDAAGWEMARADYAAFALPTAWRA
ncbi:DUF4129 domain-containing protein [Sphingomonas yunnanensis]|nr:DUF4129 domain-containing protein [Sphingomonas yunnanensis]